MEAQMTSESRSMPRILTLTTQDEVTRIILIAEDEVSATDASLPTTLGKAVNQPYDQA